VKKTLTFLLEKFKENTNGTLTGGFANIKGGGKPKDHQNKY